MDPEEVLLRKGSLGVGLALDGGRGSVFGDRPIIIKRVFEGNSSVIVRIAICLRAYNLIRKK